MRSEEDLYAIREEDTPNRGLNLSTNFENGHDMVGLMQ